MFGVGRPMNEVVLWSDLIHQMLLSLLDKNDYLI